MKKKYIKPESKVIVITEKLSLLSDSDWTFNSSEGGGRHGNAKPHDGLFDTDFEDDEPYLKNPGSLWD